MAKDKVDVYLTLRKTGSEITIRGANTKRPQRSQYGPQPEAGTRTIHFVMEVDDVYFEDVIETDVVFDVSKHALNAAPVVAHLRSIAKELE